MYISHASYLFSSTVSDILASPYDLALPRPTRVFCDASPSHHAHGTSHRPIRLRRGLP